MSHNLNIISVLKKEVMVSGLIQNPSETNGPGYYSLKDPIEVRLRLNIEILTKDNEGDTIVTS